MKYIFDTNVFIDSIRGVARARDYLKKQDGVSCSIITAAELIQGALNKRTQGKIVKLLGQLDIYPLSSIVGERMSALIKKHSLSHGLTIPDAFIAATAIEAKATLVTSNIKHFSYIKNLKLLDWEATFKQ